MRLHRLRIESFGPFAAVEHVDFDLLAQGGLFLLHGPTGAGKTSVLDAICFALYGQVPGARAAGRPRLRSDHAPQGAAPRVALELTVGGRRVEVTRTPEWLRPKKRGTGTTREPASTDIRELVDGRWQVRVGRRSDEAGLWLKDLLGMGLEQFTKVVLLPQGEFAAFLRAGADQRSDLLGKLFTIDRYVGVESWLRTERQRLSAQVQAADVEQESILARAQEAVHDLDDVQVLADAELALAGPPGPALLAALAGAAAAEHRKALHAVGEARTRAAQAQERLVRARSAEERSQRYAELNASLGQLQSRVPQHVADLLRYEQAERAAQLTPLLHRVQTATTELHEQDQLFAAGQEAVAHLLPPADPRPEAVNELLLGRQRHLARLEAAAGLDDELAHAVDRLADARRALDAAAASGVAAETDRNAATTQATALSADIDRRITQSSALSTAQSALEVALDAEQAVIELEATGQMLSAQQDALRTARDGELTARRQVLDVRERRLDGIAAELAASLTLGEPCTVCGSQTHPAPARPTDRSASEQVEGDAQAEHERAVELLRGVEESSADLSQQAAVLRSRAGALDASSAGAAVDRARELVELAQAATDLLPRLREQRELAQAAARQATERRQSADQQAAAATSLLAELEPRVSALQNAIDHVCGDDADLTAGRTRLEAEVQGLAAYCEAVGRRGAATQRLTSHTDDLTAAAARLGLTSVATVHQVLLDDAERDRLRNAIEEHTTELAAVRAQLAAPQFHDLAEADQSEADQSEADQSEADLAGAQQAALDSTTQVRQCEHRFAVAERADQALTRLDALLQEHVDGCRDLRARHAQVDELSRCVDGTGGGNGRRMRLSAFVLAARLEEVAAAATERLLVMSDGRYALSHSDELVKGGARSGLGLMVVDGWTGVSRETTTLSGGESFLASLSLALGLADVLQAEAGGTRIDTLFVDEGFGSLDEVALDDVMGVLDGLREGGRCVGVVSHVSELRDRIPTQLQVTKSRVGSRLRSTQAAVCQSPD